MKPRRFYTAGNGVRYPLYEAPYSYPITVYKTDCRKAEIGHPEQCLIALGALRDKAVEAAYIGSGRDAFVCFKATKNRKAYCLHFIINAKAARVRDYFEVHKNATTQEIRLIPPTVGRTMSHRAKLNKRRREEIKNGSPVRKQLHPRVNREQRIGIAHRPKAKIEKNVVTVPVEATQADAS